MQLVRDNAEVAVECSPDEARAPMGTEKALKHTDPVYLHSDLTDIAIGAFYRVYNGLGFGFLESVYRNALAKELSKSGLLSNAKCLSTSGMTGTRWATSRLTFLSRAESFSKSKPLSRSLKPTESNYSTICEDRVSRSG
jgi:hypothetical protein